MVSRGDINLEDIRQWDTAALAQLGQALHGRLDTVADIQIRLLNIGRLPGWRADGAEAAGAAGFGQGGLPAPIPPENGSPLENREYWDVLPGKQRQEMIDQHPEWIGNRDGIPADARYGANVNQLDSERTRLETDRDRLQGNLDAHPFGGTFTNEDAELWYTQQKLASSAVVGGDGGADDRSDRADGGGCREDRSDHELEVGSAAAAEWLPYAASAYDRAFRAERSTAFGCADSGGVVGAVVGRCAGDRGVGGGR